MSPSEQRLWTRVTNRANRLQPDIARAVLRAFANLRAAMSETEMAALIASGALDELVTRVLSDAVLETAFAPVVDRVRWGVNEAARATRRADMPRSVPPTPTVGFAFDILSPRVLDAIRVLDTRVMQVLSGAVRETVREAVTAGLTAGIGPRAIARGIRDVVGLAPNQAEWVRNFERALREGDVARVLGYTLRDARRDATVRAGNLTADQISTMVDAYRRRMVAFNAETISRTAALDAQKNGQMLSWQEAVDKGWVDGDRLMQTWRGVGDDRERDMHVAMEGVTVPFGEPFILPDGQIQMTPGDTEYGCRCLAFVFLVPAGRMGLLAA